MREARAAVKIKSEHVARVIDVGTLENGAPYMVMEYLEGSDLSALARAARRARRSSEAVEYVLQACEAIAEAHALGIVHRDLKPANLFLDPARGRLAVVKVLDFGISKVDEPRRLGRDASHDADVRRHGLAALHVARADAVVDGRRRARDIWALGVILYELIAGARPLGAALPEEISDRHRRACSVAGPRPDLPSRPRGRDPPLPREGPHEEVEQCRRASDRACGLRAQARERFRRANFLSDSRIGHVAEQPNAAPFHRDDDCSDHRRNRRELGANHTDPGRRQEFCGGEPLGRLRWQLRWWQL